MYDSDGSDEQNVPLLIHMIAGCVAGAIEATATWPFEYIKTQLQLHARSTDPKIQAILSLSELPVASEEDGVFVAYDTMPVGKALEPDDPAPYNGMVSGILYTVRTYGFWTLYHGLTPTLLGAVPKAGLRFGLFALFSALLFAHEGNNLSVTAIYFLAGLGAGAVEALVIVTPVETIKTKCIQMNMDFCEGLREILVNEGIRGVYHGLLATVLKQSSVS